MLEIPDRDSTITLITKTLQLWYLHYNSHINVTKLISYLSLYVCGWLYWVLAVNQKNKDKLIFFSSCE